MNCSIFQHVHWKCALLLFCSLVMISLPTFAAETSFSWLPNSETGIAGYRIYFGDQPVDYTNVITIDDPQVINGRIHATLTDLADETTYYAVITAYSASLESPISSEVSWTTAPASVDHPPTPQIISIREIP